MDIALLVAAAAVAGWVDAVIGGGGLILIPVLMGHLSPVAALATNKFVGFFGTASAAWTLYRKHGTPRFMFAYIPFALAASAVGAGLASEIDSEFMRPFILVMLVVVGVFVALKPDFGTQEATPTYRYIPAGLAITAISFYDGIFGPGTGMFLIMALTAIFTQTFLDSAVMAKVINACTNLGALIVFAAGGHVQIKLGLVLIVANVIGAQLGARTVLGGGVKLVRYAVLILVVVLAMSV